MVSQQQPGQWMASKLIGTTVIGANNESIGDVNDVLLDRSGQAVAVIVGVGGFLGIGEKDVAVAFNQLEFTNRNEFDRPDHRFHQRYEPRHDGDDRKRNRGDREHHCERRARPHHDPHVEAGSPERSPLCPG